MKRSPRLLAGLWAGLALATGVCAGCEDHGAPHVTKSDAGSSSAPAASVAPVATPKRAVIPLAGDRRHVVYLVANRNSNGTIVARGYTIHVRDRNGATRQLARPRGMDLVHGRWQLGPVIEIGLVHATFEVLVVGALGPVRAYWWNPTNQQHGSVLLPGDARTHHDILEVVPGGTAFAYKTVTTEHPAGAVYKQAHDGTITEIARPYSGRTYKTIAGDDGIVFVGLETPIARYMSYEHPGRFVDLPLPKADKLENVHCDRPGRRYINCDWQPRFDEDQTQGKLMSVNGDDFGNADPYYAMVDDAGLTARVYDDTNLSRLRTTMPDGREVISDPKVLPLCACAEGRFLTWAIHGYDKSLSWASITRISTSSPRRTTYRSASLTCRRRIGHARCPAVTGVVHAARDGDRSVGAGQDVHRAGVPTG